LSAPATFGSSAGQLLSLATSAKQGIGRIQNVELLGAGKMKFTRDETALKIQLPDQQPSEHAIAFKIIGA
jgi:alpha-L-fucosidase